MYDEISPVNFLAIEFSERLGINEPSEKQIEMIETLLTSTIMGRPFFLNEHLNEKENLCLMFAAQGKSSKETADLLALTQTQIEFYRKEVRRKLNSNSMAQAVYEAVKAGYFNSKSLV